MSRKLKSSAGHPDFMPMSMTLDSISLADTGTFLLYDGIDAQTAYEVSEFILKANTINFADDLTLFINSGGGSVPDGFAIIDMMELSRVDIRTVAIGEIASMGVSIFITGTKGKRIMSPNCMVMTHQFYMEFGGKYHELMASRKLQDQTAKQFIEHFQRHTKMTEEQIKDILLGSSDRWLTPQECLEFGICDEVRNPWDIRP